MPLTTTPKVKYRNHTKVLLCYLLAWGLALLLPYLGLAYVYPYKLAGSAPDLSQTLTLLPLSQATQDTLAAASAQEVRDLLWRFAVGAVLVLCAALSLLVQLIWRFRYIRPRLVAKATQQAIAQYRLFMLVIWGINLLGALIIYLLGVRWIGGRTLWDYLLYFGGFVLIPLAAMACFRLAAPPAISGRRAFFKRL